MPNRFRVIYNQDCTNLFGIVKEPIEPRHVDRMVNEVADGGADLLLVNPNAQRVNYPSRVWQTFWDGYAPGRREFFGPVPDADVPGREAWVSQMKRLADQGCDYLARALARCRKKRITPGVTVRMNDMHDVPWPGSNLFGKFYMAHPELRLQNPSVCGWSATGLNYEHKAVRDHYLALIRELAGGYDFDVLELDFLRFHCYFPRRDFDRHCAIMTGFVRDVRAILSESGRPIELMARVATHPAAAYELGFDVQAWAREGLVDIVSAGAFLNTSWGIAVDEFRSLVGDGVAVYACTDHSADRREGLHVRALPSDPRLLRGFAAGYLAAGADGVEFFNFFCTREESPPRDPLFAVLRELRDLDGLRGQPKTYTVTSGWAVAEVDGAYQAPVALPTTQPRAFHMFMAAEPAGTRVEADFLLAGKDDVRPDQLWLLVNSVPAGTARTVLDVPAGEKCAAEKGAEDKRMRIATFALPAAALRDGRNVLVLRNEAAPLTVLSLDVRVG